jgi:hypothetical protein
MNHVMKFALFLVLYLFGRLVLAARSVQLNLADIPGDTMDPGTYEAILLSVTIKDSKNTPGNTYLNWQFEIAEGHHTGKHVWLMTSLAPQALFGVKAAFKALGMDTSAIAELNFDDRDRLEYPMLDNIPVQIQIENREYLGESRAQVKKIIGTYVELGAGGLTEAIGSEEYEEDPDSEEAEIAAEAATFLNRVGDALEGGEEDSEEDLEEDTSEEDTGARKKSRRRQPA